MNTTAQTPARRRWFRTIAFCSPFLLLLAVEGILRLTGFGYPTRFFLKSKVRGESLWIENQEFANRFFPPKLARSPQPTVLSLRKPKNTMRIFVFGESAAMGDPEPAFGFGRILDVLLSARDPNRKVEVVNVSVTAINSHVVRQIARDCGSMEGDYWIIYMGNNEVVGPYGAGTVFGAQTPDLGLIRASLAFKSTRIGQLADRIRNRLRLGPQTPSSWEGMEMFLKQQVSRSDPRMRKVYAHFASNLSSILETARKSGAQVLLCTVASNWKDCPPFASTSDAESANALFGQAQAFLAAGKQNEALNGFVRARDLDTLRFRADSEINTIIRKATAAGSTLLDLEEVIRKASKDGIPGQEFFFDHVHFNFDGNYLIARTLAEQIGTNSQWLTRDECAGLLAFTEWDEFQVFDEMVKRTELPPFSNQLGHAERLAALKERRAQLEAKLKPELHDRWIEVYASALRAAPNDWVLHENFAQLLQSIGEAQRSEKEWRRLTELLSHSAPAWYGLGNVLDGLGKGGEALLCFQRALKLNPNAIEARNGMGLALASAGRPGEAKRQFEAALRMKPDFAEGRVNLGLTLAQQGQHEAAIHEYETALRYNSNSVAAHLNLGKALLLRGNTNSAIAHYREAVRIKPDHVIAQYNLGNALAAQGNSAGVTHLSEAARLKPEFVEAHYNLGLELAKATRYEEALVHLEKAAELKPNFADAYFNLGVAYAKQKRFGDAVTAFETCLRLDPQHAVARKYLEQARNLQAKGL